MALNTLKIARYGWKPDIPDARDLKYMAPPHITLPASLDLRAKCPAVYDQGALGSCTANAIAGAMQFDRLKEGLEDFTPSRLMIYYDERVIEGSVNEDSGAMIRDGMKAVHKHGACPEPMWPYDTSKFTVKPSAEAYAAAKHDRVLAYRRVPRSLYAMKVCIYQGYPFVFGFSVYDSFESEAVAKTGIVPIPAPDEGLLGGHAVTAVGYNDEAARFIVRNSWGAGWGQSGYFELPYEFFTNPDLSDDFWTVRDISDS